MKVACIIIFVVPVMRMSLWGLWPERGNMEVAKHSIGSDGAVPKKRACTARMWILQTTKSGFCQEMARKVHEIIIIIWSPVCLEGG